MRIAIAYRDSSGGVTDREISDFVPQPPDAIDAFCHLRQERRTFRVSNIIRAFDPETGVLIENPWRDLGLAKLPSGGQNPLASIGPALPAVLALKYFTKKFRGLRERERSHLLQFIRRHAAMTQLDATALDEWLRTVWAGDEEAHIVHLTTIPGSLRADCRATALNIGRGSGRRPIDASVIEAIDQWFP